MFGISSLELLVILLVAVVVLGPERLPKIMLKVAKVLSEFRKISTELQRTVNAEIHLQEHNKLKKEAEQELFGHNAVKKKKKRAVLPADSPVGQTQPAPEDAKKNAEKSESNNSDTDKASEE